MKTSLYLKETVGLTMLATVLPAGCTGELNNQDKPNIVVVLADDLGWGDVGYHGSHIQTPHLDELAKTGIRLNRFYVSPVSTPTRASLLTGRYPNRMGVRHVVIPPWRDYGIEPHEVFLSQELGKAGYEHRTIIGKWHLGHSRKKYYPLRKGFTHFYGHLNGAIDFFNLTREGELDWHNDWDSSYDKGYSTELLTNHAVQCIRDYAKGEAPFFVYVAYNAPHSPLQAPDEDLKLYGFDPDKPRFGKGDKTGRGNNKAQTYAAMVTAMDRGIGEIIETLEETGELDNTLFLFFSDNGQIEGSSGELRGRKFLEFEGGVRVPALLSWPARLEGGKTINQVMGAVDVMPTILDVLNVQSEAQFDGKSMLSVLTEEKDTINRNLYLGLGAVVSNEWKFIEKGHNPKMDMASDMLFKIDEDPGESMNVIHAHKEIANELKAYVNRYDTIQPPRPLPDYAVGREGFVAPKEWAVTEE